VWGRARGNSSPIQYTAMSCTVITRIWDSVSYVMLSPIDAS
jgi:hypothetical protein